MFSQHASSTGWTRAKSSSEAPTMALRRPASASAGVRASGASTKDAPRSASAAAMRVLEAGSLVEQSTTMRPLVRPFQKSVRSVDDVLNLGRSRHADEYQVGAGGEFAITRELGRPPADQFFDRGPVAVGHDGERIAGGEDVLRHAATHEPGTGEPHALRHRHRPHDLHDRSRNPSHENIRSIPTPVLYRCQERIFIRTMIRTNY